MNALAKFGAFIGKFFEPIRRNASFFFFMYVTGIVGSYLVDIPQGDRDAIVYKNLWLELFFDLYIVSAILTLIPLKVRRWIRPVIYVVVYLTTWAEVFCFVKFSSPISPTILLLISETNGHEAGEFISTYLRPDIIFSRIGIIPLIVLLHIATNFWPLIKKHIGADIPSTLHAFAQQTKKLQPLAGAVVIVLFVWSGISSWQNKKFLFKLFSSDDIGEVEHTLTEGEYVDIYLPVYRLAFSIMSNELASHQVTDLIRAKDNVKVDSCSYRSPNIILIIGESYGKQHSEMYGYFMPTTPRQIQRRKEGRLTAFSDVVTPYNLTSFVFKNVLSMHVIGQKGTWSDYPLFPELFRKAGYHTAFITNQFLPRATEAVYDFSGGFFLNHPELSEAMFDTRNDQLYRYDDGLLKVYDDEISKQNTDHNLIIFHLIGQHVSYNKRYPADRERFTGDDYKESRPELEPWRRRFVAYYDNATLYNDSIVDQIINRFDDQDAIIIYMPDHGEECNEGTRNIICRNHSAFIDWPLAHYEYEIPFWIYCTHTYAERHPDIFAQVIDAKDRPFMTDALPHMLLYLAGIKCKDYHEEYNLLSPDYNEKRPRLLLGTTDYDKLRRDAMAKENKE